MGFLSFAVEVQNESESSPACLADSVLTRELPSHLLDIAIPVAREPPFVTWLQTLHSRTEVLSHRAYISSNRGSTSWKRRSSSCSSRSCRCVLPVMLPLRQSSWTPPMDGRRAQQPAHRICPPGHQTILHTPASPHLTLGAVCPRSRKREVKWIQGHLLWVLVFPQSVWCWVQNVFGSGCWIIWSPGIICLHSASTKMELFVCGVNLCCLFEKWAERLHTLAREDVRGSSAHPNPVLVSRFLFRWRGKQSDGWQDFV